MKHRTYIDIWRVTTSQPLSVSKRGAEIKTRIQLQGYDHIQCHALSPDGRYLAISSLLGTKVWLLDKTQEGGMIAIKRVKLPTSLVSKYCLSLIFSHGCRHLTLYTSGRIVVLELLEDDSDVCPTAAFLHSINHWDSVKVLSDEVPQFDFAVRELSLSSDGLYLAVSDGCFGVYIYNIDLLRLHWKLPLFTHPISSMKFHPRISNFFVVLLSNGRFLTFDVENISMTSWSSSSSLQLPTTAIAFNPNLNRQFFLYGQGAIVNITLDAVHEVSCESNSGKSKEKNRNISFFEEQRSLAADKSFSYSASISYKGLVHVGCLDNGEMVSTCDL